jgi:hypothetical protein
VRFDSRAKRSIGDSALRPLSQKEGGQTRPTARTSPSVMKKFLESRAIGKDFTNPRAAFTKAVRALTSSARARITVRWICAFALRWRTGPNSSGSMRASLARVRASCRSSFRLLLVINSTFCACATITSCRNSVNSRLTHGECVPVSRAIRLCGILPNACFIASGVVATFCSRMILPASPKHSRTINDPLDPHRWLAFAAAKFHY